MSKHTFVLTIDKDRFITGLLNCHYPKKHLLREHASKVLSDLMTKMVFEAELEDYDYDDDNPTELLHYGTSDKVDDIREEILEKYMYPVLPIHLHDFDVVDIFEDAFKCYKITYNGKLIQDYVEFNNEVSENEIDESESEIDESENESN